MKDTYNILKDKFCEGVTIEAAARADGLSVARGWSERDRISNTLRALYAHETGHSADPKFTDGLGRMQWEYGIRGTDYWQKDKRQAVLAYMGAV